MAQQQNQDTPTIIGFGSIQLLKTQTLGIGSYGKVCKAKCDDLLCAAKVLHETLFDPTAQQQIARHREHRLPFRRFQQECEFMSAIKHPNIVQYLGMHQDPETGLPVLLMELMDDSLTHFLESSQYPVPYHIQVNFCHDITLAISYLHSNGIIHRDLSSNNVLLRGNVIAKVTDFGMAKLSEATPRATRISLTMVPGTDAYMPPEATKDQPVYTAKIDCFAIGALIIQILTRLFPDPGERLKTVRTTDPQFPGGIAYVPASEIERRQNHISQVDPYHPLLTIALHCLKDSDVKRPSAQELCHRVAALKETPQYIESVRSAQEREEQIRELQRRIQQKNDIIQEKDEQRAQQIQGLQQIIRSQNDRLQGKEQAILANQHEIHQLREQLEKTIRDEERERQLQVVAQQLETSQNIIAQFQSRIHDLEKQLETKPPELIVRKEKNLSAPSAMFRGPDALVSSDVVYFRPDGTRRIYTYKPADDEWNQFPDFDTLHSKCSLVVVENLLTTVGGNIHYDTPTNKLVSLNGEGSNRTWSEVFPAMPTKRTCLTAVCNGQALIVAGGKDSESLKTLKVVEVMDIATKEWSTAADLPEALSEASATICGDCIYILGGMGERRSTNSVYTCSLADLFLSCQSRSLGERLTRSLSLTGHARSTVWNKVADLPVTLSTCVTLHSRLLAIGGKNSNNETTSDIHMYNATSNQWEIISRMTEARYLCFAAVLPNNQLLVVGGRTGQTPHQDASDSVEIITATLI